MAGDYFAAQARTANQGEEKMIDNSDTVGHYFVQIIARRNSVCGFQCPTLADVREEVSRITRERMKDNLPVAKAIVQEIVGRAPLKLGPVIEL